MEIRFIGDVHGKWSRYKALIKECDRSLQVGDFGVGFRNYRTGEKLEGPPTDAMAQGEHFFIRGNHDNLEECKGHPYYVADGESALGRDDIFCVGGALSIDKHLRTEGYDWWHDEELSYSQLCKIIEVYELAKPRVVISHECPESVISRVYPGMLDIPCATRKCFDNMLESHKPDLWIHGHWHIDYHIVHKGVDFMGLGELSHLDLDI